MQFRYYSVNKDNNVSSWISWKPIPFCCTKSRFWSGRKGKRNEEYFGNVVCLLQFEYLVQNISSYTSWKNPAILLYKKQVLKLKRRQKERKRKKNVNVVSCYSVNIEQNMSSCTSWKNPAILVYRNQVLKWKKRQKARTRNNLAMLSL